jgi:hypothetical protein
MLGESERYLFPFESRQQSFERSWVVKAELAFRDHAPENWCGL